MNVFVIKTENGLICFDAGWRSSAVLREFERLGLDPGSVTAVFLTHSDRDHTSAIDLFDKAVFYANVDELPLFNGIAHRFMVRPRNLIKGREKRWCWLEDGERVDVAGISVTAIKTPGHTPGSLCYLAGPGLIFAGDAAWKYGSPRPLPCFFNEDHSAALHSLNRLMMVKNGRKLLTAHSGIIDIGNCDMKTSLSGGSSLLS